MEKNHIVKLAVDLAKGKVQNFSVDESNDTLRKALADLFEFSTKDGKFEIDRKTFRKHKADIFEILEVVINETLQEGLKNQFDGFAEYRNLAWGDENLFHVTNTRDIYKVALISDGNGNIRRQRLRDGETFSVSLDTYGIKIGEDFHRFLAGRIQWADLMGLIAESFKRDLTQRIADAVMASYGKYNSTYHTSVNTFTEDDLITMAMHIEARTGEKVAVYGTKLALRKLAPSQISQNMMDGKNVTGYYGNIAGIDLREIAQTHNYGTESLGSKKD